MNIRSFNNKTPLLGQRVYIDSTAVVMGDVTFGDDCSVFPMSVIRADVNHVTIGKGTNIQDGAVLHVNHASTEFDYPGDPLIIGDYVTIGHRAVLHGCTIGNYCLIGINAVVLDRVVIPDYVLIGANSLVAPGKTLESGFVYMGSPAKKARVLTDDEMRYFEYSAKHYMKLKDAYLTEMSSPLPH